ncbi:MAG: TonB-dependent receptor [Bacteroidales bacterium]|nr:TonB-dependent receptor [Bacteroidales bacterium]
MKRFRILILSLAALLTGFGAAAQQTFTLSGTVVDKGDGAPVEFATVVLSSGQWAVCDAKGAFTIAKVAAGKTTVVVSCVGYVEDKREITVSKDIRNYRIQLAQDNLALEGAVVTAQESSSAATTSRTIDKTALEHVQLMNVSSISGLMPGGATANPSLTSEQQFNIRASGAEEGNASFGTAVEVDGVRLSNNAAFGQFSSTSQMKGVATNNIASTNVESVEVITGVPSVEYGDMTSGIVKINTRKGKTPWMVTLSTSPNTKQVSASKGFGLGEARSGASRGVINSSVEYTRSISEPMSPYTAYDRAQLSMTWSNLFNKGAFVATPLRFSVGVTGNVGGYNTKADPDQFKNTYTNVRDNVIRGNFSLNWLLSKPWITNVEMNGSISYSDKFSRENKNYSSAVGKVELHGSQEGYYIARSYEDDPTGTVLLIPRGYWYNEMVEDNRPLSWKLGIKANWARNFGKINNKLKIGADWTGDGNFGRGVYSSDFATAPTYRDWLYSDKPFMHNLALYAEDNVMIPVGREGRLNLITGIRQDRTMIRDSHYGTVSSLSPRFNVKYTVFSEKDHHRDFFRALAFRASWGLAVKLPSYSILYPTPSYYDRNVFDSPTDAAGNSYVAYKIMPRTMEYNADLKFQRNRQSEVGVEANLGGMKISLAGFYNLTLDAYVYQSEYRPHTYLYTQTSAVSGCLIPEGDRIYSIDRTTGVVTVSDRTGTYPAMELPYIVKNEFASRPFVTNAVQPMRRYGMEWVVDFPKIKSINTTIRIDGTWYNYKAFNANTTAFYQTNLPSADGTPFKYLGFFYGDDSYGNGRRTSNVNTNLTLTTHIPKVRMILSLKVETSLLKFSQAISERVDGTPRSYVISDRNDLLSFTNESLYEGEHYVVCFPDYYVSFADPTTLRPFLDDYRAAIEAGDNAKAKDLRGLAKLTSYTNTFLPDYITPYFSANISVTKEIGDLASVSFYANNFFNNLSQVRSSRTGNYESVSGYIPSFYYGLTVRLKF